MIDETKPRDFNDKSIFILGCDLARRGADETAYVVLEKPFNSENIYVVYMETIHNKTLTECIGRVLNLNSFFNFSKIILDETGLGGGVTDVLKEKLGGIVEGITFTRNSKPEMFINLKLLLQRKILKLPDHQMNDISKKLFYQMLSIQQEFKGDSDTPRIFHESRSHDDMACALALASTYFHVGGRKKRTYGLFGLLSK